MTKQKLMYKIGDHIINSKMDAEVLGFIDDLIYKGSPSMVFYKLKCTRCGYIFRRDYFTAQRKEVGCPCCANRVIVPGINDIPTTDPWMVPYFQRGYEQAKLYGSGSSKTIYPKCPTCGRIKNTPMAIRDIREYNGFQCVCHDGKTFPNKFIYGLAQELKRTNQITYFKEERKIENKLYDMFFPEKETLVEMDSGLNHGHVLQKHNKKIIPSSKYINDIQKDNIAKRNDLNIIRIDCFKSDFEYIKENIINSELSSLFDLSIIDWNHILKLCSTNLVQEVCRYKQQNPNLSPNSIAPKFGLSNVTVRKYLKMGKELGWCNYNPEEGRSFAIPIRVESIEDKKVTVEYNSISECQRKSKQDFGRTIWASTLISRNIHEKGFVEVNGFRIYVIKGDN